MEIISAQNIVKQYRTGHGIEGICLSVRTGQCFGVLGSNGSGKTTLTRLIAGLDRIEQGCLDVLGRPAYPQPPELRRRCGAALDTPAHWENLSGRQNLSFFAAQYGLSAAALARRIEQLLTEADLAAQADEPVAVYSFGMRRKLNIIEALVHDPDLLILDEPSAGIDTAFLDRLTQWIHRRCEEGKTTWIADNDADWLGRTATDVILLSQGRITAAGNVKDLLDSIEARCQIDITLAQPGFGQMPTLAGIRSFHCEGSQIHAQVNGDPELPSRLMGWIASCGGQVRSMQVRSVTLQQSLEHIAAQKETAV